VRGFPKKPSSTPSSYACCQTISCVGFVPYFTNAVAWQAEGSSVAEEVLVLLRHPSSFCIFFYRLFFAKAKARRWGCLAAYVARLRSNPSNLIRLVPA